jgi:WD40 repeat protein
MRISSTSGLVVLALLTLAPIPALARHEPEPAGTKGKVDRHGDALPSLARLRIGTVRFRHGDEIVALAFSPDGRRLATLGRDGILSLWDAADGKGLAHFSAPDGVAVVFGQRGKTLLWCNARGRLYRCDTDQRGDDLDGQRQSVHTFDLDPSERIDAVAFLPDGSAASVGTSSHRVLFWGRKAELRLRDGIQALALDRDGKLLAVNNGLEGIHLHDVSGQRKARGPLRAFGDEAVRSLAFTPDGRLLAAGDFDNRIHLWDTTSGRETRVLEGHRRVPISGRNGVFCLAFRPDGARLASGAADGTVRIWDVKSGKELARADGHGGRVRAVAFAPDGKTLASGGADNALRLWETATGRATGPVPDDGGAVMNLSVSADGRTLAVVRMPGRLSLWDVKEGKELTKMPKVSEPISAAVFRARGRTFIAATATGRLHFWEADKGEELRSARKTPASIRLLAAANDGATVAWCGNDRRVVLWDTAAGKERRQFQAPGNTITQLGFSPDGQTLVVAGTAGARLFEITEGSSRDLSGKVGPVFAAAVSPDGRMLATGGQDGTVRLWETASAKQRRTMYGDTSPIRSAAFSADGAVLATGSANGSIRLWDVARKRRLHTFTGHRGAVIAVAFAQADATLITASRDGTALVWDLPALLEVGRARTIELSPQQVQALWRDLGSDDAARAYEVVETLARAPARAVPLLRENLSPMSAEKRAHFIADLDSDHFETRDRAKRELAAMGKFAEPALRKLLREKPSLEARRRAEEVLERLKNPATLREHLRCLRAVEVLETIGTEPARKVLQTLAGGAAEAALTREAKAALERLNKKSK